VSFAGGLTLTLAAGVLLWWVPSSIAETALWKTGAIAYLWPVAAAVLILGQVVALLSGATFGRPRLALLALATAFFATFLEPLSVVMGAALTAATAFAWHRRQANRTALLVLLVAHGLGTLVLIVAPGNFVRLGTVPDATPAAWASAWFWFLRSLFDRYAAGLFALVLAVWGAAAAGTSHNGAVRALRDAGLCLLPRAAPFAAFILCYLLTLLPVPAAALPSRAGFPVSVALCGIALLMLQDGIRRIELARSGRGVLVALSGLVALLLVPASGVFTLRDVMWSAALQQDFPPLPRERPAEIRDIEIVVPMPPHATRGRYAASKTRFFLLPGPEEFAWAGGCLAGAHGVKRFTVR
jgi:hypothetical protein